jgi:hypothetical protein
MHSPGERMNVCQKPAPVCRHTLLPVRPDAVEVEKPALFRVVFILALYLPQLLLVERVDVNPAHLRRRFHQLALRQIIRLDAEVLGELFFSSAQPPFRLVRQLAPAGYVDAQPAVLDCGGRNGEVDEQPHCVQNAQRLGALLLLTPDREQNLNIFERVLDLFRRRLKRVGRRKRLSHALVERLARPAPGDGGKRVRNVETERDDAIRHNDIPLDLRENAEVVEEELHIKGEVRADERNALEYRDEDIQPDARRIEAVSVAVGRCELDEENARRARV